MFRAASYELGRIEVTEAGGERFWITDRERTVVDAFRLGHLVGDTTAHPASRRYLDQPRPKLAQLADLARDLRASTAVRVALAIPDT
ncbi:MAG TPA: hypothetical protein VHA73_07720 [Acidimicrobiales bacterium]|nr:hypothetical protein [Acidimicrobiales bacterium]